MSNLSREESTELEEMLTRKGVDFNKLVSISDKQMGKLAHTISSYLSASEEEKESHKAQIVEILKS